MNSKEKQRLKDWVDNWKSLGKVLEDLRRQKIRTANLEETIIVMNDAFLSAIHLQKSRKTSGLVEFHKFMARSL